MSARARDLAGNVSIPATPDVSAAKTLLLKRGVELADDGGCAQTTTTSAGALALLALLLRRRRAR